MYAAHDRGSLRIILNGEKQCWNLKWNSEIASWDGRLQSEVGVWMLVAEC